MKRITLSVAFLLFGGAYMANAQVGIGTPTPNASSQLDIVSENSGVLIPRVKLNRTDEFGPIKGAPAGVQSLLVYNTQTIADVVPGFYYWENAKWNRIINQTDLETAINNFGGDLTEIKKLVSFILPSSPVNNPAVPQTHTTMVYNPTTKQISFVTYDTATSSYKTDLVDVASLVAGAETKTFIRTITAAGGNVQHIYFGEQAIQNWIAANPATNTVVNIPDNAPGGVTIDAGADIVQNFENILNQTTTYGVGTMTIKNIIKELAGVADGNVIYKNIGVSPAVEWVFQYWNGTAYTTITLGDLIKENETKTRILKTTVDSEIVYNYANEANKPDATGVSTVGTPDVINVTADMITSITNNENVKTAIKNVLRGGGNVFYTLTAIAAGDNDGTAIPAGSLYTVDAAGKKIVIDISGTVITAITNNAETVKTILGDNYNQINHFKTGDTWINGKPIYAFKSTTNIVVNSAVASTVTLPVSADNIVSVKLYKGGNLVTSSTTDLVLAGTALNFNIGTGNMYNILPVGSYEVIVEFTPTVVPAP
ncbi:hypothetical protein [Flavobacterium sp. HSC-61S13]|uniref:hypothetical protein n=1 Tax=Flavobacterium sp. HSC-61S13 TaxID=2910963 RepID=UPI00209F03CA|nr:hypothetical protein [Flavobacterium sp. HSC-61S13]MCP1996774.1 hypothetical protein [Flavobacterium sp. HSC-61S13]